MATFTVTTAIDEIEGDARLSLREAVARANATPGADAIVFAVGLEGRTLTLQAGQLRITDDLRIDGNRDGNRSEVTIDGGGTGRVLLVGGEATAVRLEDLTISGGDIEAGAADANGGGIRLAGGNQLTLTRCTVEDNDVGGFLPPGFSDGQVGGGIYAAAQSRLTVVDSLLDSNGAIGGGGAIGAAAGASVVVRGSELTSNGAYENGAAIALFDGATLALTASTVSANGTSGRGSYGGGIFLSGGSATITGSTLAGNSAFGLGSGGGIAARGGEVVLTNSTLAGNQADLGAAIFGSETSTVVLTGSTVTGNTSEYSGFGAIAANGRLEVANSIVAGNFTFNDPGSASDVVGAVTRSNGHNIFGSDVAGSVAGDLEGVSPARLFAALDAGSGGGRLALNGGPTPTVRLRDAVDNPALSGADPLGAGTVDQRGGDRPLPADTNPDIGAFELDQRQVSRSASANNDVLTGTAGDDLLAALAGNDLARGGDGDDGLLGLAGSDTLAGGRGRDVLDGGSGRDLLRGGSGADGLRGGFDGDVLLGGEGDDRLAGGRGTDMLRGEVGRDVFAFAAGDTGVGPERRDVIADFARVLDHIDLAAVDAVAGGVDDAFAFVGRQAFSAAGQLRFTPVGGDTIVQANIDADGAPEFELLLEEAVALKAGDFLL